MRTACIAATRAILSWFCSYYTPYFSIISIICTIIRIVSKLEIQIWVHIHCRKLSSRHILPWGSVSKQNHEQERLKHQESKDPASGQWRSSFSRSTRICLTEVRHPASAHSRFKLITQCINCLGNAYAFVPPDMIRDTEFDTHLKILI